MHIKYQISEINRIKGTKDCPLRKNKIVPGHILEKRVRVRCIEKGTVFLIKGTMHTVGYASYN